MPHRPPRGDPPLPTGAFPVFTEGFDEGFGRPAEGRQVGRFYRQGGHLLLVPSGRGVNRGILSADVVSEPFVYELADNTPSFTASEAQIQVASAWATHSASATATLKAAIDEALQDAGFRAPDGTDLT